MATNLRNNIDEAIQSRVGETIRFSRPTIAQCKQHFAANAQPGVNECHSSDPPLCLFFSGSKGITNFPGRRALISCEPEAKCSRLALATGHLVQPCLLYGLSRVGSSAQAGLRTRCCWDGTCSVRRSDRSELFFCNLVCSSKQRMVDRMEGNWHLEASHLAAPIFDIPPAGCEKGDGWWNAWPAVAASEVGAAVACSHADIARKTVGHVARDSRQWLIVLTVYLKSEFVGKCASNLVPRCRGKPSIVWTLQHEVMKVFSFSHDESEQAAMLLGKAWWDLWPMAFHIDWDRNAAACDKNAGPIL